MAGRQIILELSVEVFKTGDNGDNALRIVANRFRGVGHERSKHMLQVRWIRLYRKRSGREIQNEVYAGRDIRNQTAEPLHKFREFQRFEMEGALSRIIQHLPRQNRRASTAVANLLYQRVYRV